MKFSENWLRELVEIPVDRDTLVERLTMSGLEVEELTPLGEDLAGLIVAEILDCQPHPDADRLRVCRVGFGGDRELTIVCGAPNARAGLKAPLAPVGSRLPGGLVIGKAELRGVASEGMLCSAKELQLDDDASGLMELPADATVGAPLAEVLALPDASIELKLTPNRADCLGLVGLADDVAAQFGGAITPPPADPVKSAHDEELAIGLEAGAGCPRYCGRVIRGVDPGAPSPLWLRQRLRRAGLRPISALVDVTNYVMLELGQPLHAFDRDSLSGGIRVRRAAASERLKLLDERELTLDGECLVIADDRGTVALAGIMGGFDTRVTDATRNVFLESAHFAPDAISGRARRFGMHTDASHRFERGVDPELPRRALERATALLLAIAGGEAGPVVESTLDDELPKPQPVRLRRARLARVLGLEVPDTEVERILRALGMEVTVEADGWTARAPSRRFDIEREEDLIEEVVRVHGYQRVPTHPPSGDLRLAALPEARIAESALRRLLVARDFVEAINYAFIDAALAIRWKLDQSLVRLANPLSAELGVMRPALAPGLVAALGRNLARQQSRVRLFELGRTFAAVEGEAPRETPSIAAVATGPVLAEQWGSAGRALDFHDLKGDLEALLALSGESRNFRFEASDALPWLHAGRAARVHRGDRVVGWIGQLDPRLQHALELDQDVYAFEIALEPLVDRQLPRAGAVSRFPSVRRDIAVLVAEATPWSAVEASLRRALGGQLRDLLLFDRYQGKGVETGFKSLAIGLILQDVSRTLTDHDADAAVASALDALASDCGARLRG